MDNADEKTITSTAIDEAKFCRLGKYRDAAIYSLRRYRKSGEISPSLCLSLARLGRFRLSLIFTISLMANKAAFDAQCISIIEKGLKGYQPSEEEIKEAIASTKSIRLPPPAVSAIGTKIVKSSLCDFFFEEYIRVHAYTRAEIQLTEAFVARIHGDELKALSIIQQLIESKSLVSQSCELAIEILLSNEYTYEAQRYACLALRQNPNSIFALEALGLCLYKRARWKASRKIFAKIHQSTKDDFSLLNSLITLPLLTLSRFSLKEAVKGFDNLKQLLADKPQLLGIAKSLELCKAPLPSEFYLAYEGPVPIRRNLEAVRNYQRLSASSLLREIKSCYSSNKSNETTERHDGKIRIGFISRFFSHHSNLAAHSGLISQLNRKYFDVLVIHRSGVVKDDDHNALNAAADSVIYLADELGESCGIISRLSLDILFFTDLGMNPFDCILAMPHLARYQITSWGLPHTTGVREIDFYLRSSIFSDCEGQSEYTEKLVDLPGYIGYFSHGNSKPNNASRDYFLIPPDRFLIGCLQSLHKIHPEFDSYLEQIAKIDASILIIISPSEGDQLMKDFLKRLKKSAPTAYQQLCIVQRTSLDDFFSLNAILDLNLDTINYGAGISFIQTAWCGPPYITQHSNLVRASTVSRSYRYAGVKNPPIAYSQAEYVELVRYYFNHRTELSRLRAEIQARAEGSIYDNRDYIRGYEDFFRDLCSHGNDLHPFSKKNTSTA